MQPSLYRRYNIAGITPGDDYAAMRQVLHPPLRQGGRRRGARCPAWCSSTAARARSRSPRQVLRRTGPGCRMSLVGVAKGEGRKVGLETLVFADGRAPGRPGPGIGRADADRPDPRTRRTASPSRACGPSAPRRATCRSLEEIEGVGARRRQRLLARFGGLSRRGRAPSIEDLAVGGRHLPGAGPAHLPMRCIGASGGQPPGRPHIMTAFVAG